jgi:hypothetical protein
VERWPGATERRAAGTIPGEDRTVREADIA